MIYTNAIKIEKTGHVNYSGTLEVKVTLNVDGKTIRLTDQMYPEEIELSLSLMKIEDEKLRDDIRDAAEDYGTVKYSEGYYEGSNSSF